MYLSCSLSGSTLLDSSGERLRLLEWDWDRFSVRLSLLERSLTGGGLFFVVVVVGDSGLLERERDLLLESELDLSLEWE